MITNADFLILDLIANLKCPFLDWLFILCTYIGDGGMLWILIAILCLFFKKTRKTGLCMALALILGVLIANIGLKPLVKRLRPFQIREMATIIPQPTDYSFPSGHTVSSFAAAFAIFKGNKKWGTVSFAVAGLIAFSRLYLYVHFPSDVIVGIAIGLFCGYISNKIVKKV